MIIIKKGYELTEEESLQIKKSIYKEFNAPFTPEKVKERLFFLLKENEIILAQGVLWEVKPVFFNGQEFIFHGILNVIANQKGQGYGKQVVMEIKNYLLSHNLTGIGFCFPKNQGFYEKCGFSISATATKQFVYTVEDKKITNQDGQFVFYQDSSDHFMEKVLANLDKEVSIPTEDLW